jgi:hypothetical protein
MAAGAERAPGRAARVAPHGTLAERKGMQPSLRGLDGEMNLSTSG